MGADDNSAAFATLDRMIEACRSMPGMVKREAPAVASLLRNVIAQSVSAGRSPEGQAWAPTKSGNAPLQGAMGAVSVQVVSDGVDAIVTGYHVFHQRGTSRLPARPFIPETMPGALAEATRQLFKERWEASMEAKA